MVTFLYLLKPSAPLLAILNITAIAAATYIGDYVLPYNTQLGVACTIGPGPQSMLLHTASLQLYKIIWNREFPLVSSQDAGENIWTEEI
jgi:hypothetical protein